ncbi:HNH endonuclease signature motif containing protein [Bordetella hinzii]|uniref:HNH endonuclease signature motif containing protein n=1 Tax=Bordetella hinzii TaxID=103855 RepID=UPI00163BC493|nr:HNH endonuclease signature motif containing protein [Bordetella hinzii]
MEIENLIAVDATSKSGLRWLVSTGRVRAGAEAGWICVHQDGSVCWQVQVQGKLYLAHRLVLQLHTGSPVPSSADVDHLDGNSLNNQVENLRVVTRSQNNRNLAVRKTSSTGAKGVTFHEKRNRYLARVVGADGRVRSASFPCKKLGRESAFALAKAWRVARIQELNEQGAGYTFRHMADVYPIEPLRRLVKGDE